MLEWALAQDILTSGFANNKGAGQFACLLCYLLFGKYHI